MTGDDSVDALIGRADPLRQRDDRFDPDLIERILANGPAPGRFTSARPAIAFGAVATAAVTVGAFALVQLLGAGGSTAPSGTPAPTAPPASSMSPSPNGSPSQGQCVKTGWKARSLPAGYQVSDPAQTERTGWQGSWEKADGRYPVVLRVICGTLGVGDLSLAKPNTQVGGRPAHLTQAAALWLSVQQAPGVVLELSSYPPDQASLPVVLAIAGALTDDPNVAGAPTPTNVCSTQLDAWHVTPPAGYRQVASNRDAAEGLRKLRYQRGTSIVDVSLNCPGFADPSTSPGSVAVPVPFGRAWFTQAAGKPQVVWQADTQFIVFVDPQRGPVTKDEVLAFLRGASRD
jgi:hypothetical protein